MPLHAWVAGATGYTGQAVVAILRARGVPTTAHVRPDSSFSVKRPEPKPAATRAKLSPTSPRLEWHLAHAVNGPARRTVWGANARCPMPGDPSAVVRTRSSNTTVPSPSRAPKNTRSAGMLGAIRPSRSSISTRESVATTPGVELTRPGVVAPVSRLVAGRASSTSTWQP